MYRLILTIKQSVIGSMEYIPVENVVSISLVMYVHLYKMVTNTYMYVLSKYLNLCLPYLITRLPILPTLIVIFVESSSRRLEWNEMTKAILSLMTREMQCVLCRLPFKIHSCTLKKHMCPPAWSNIMINVTFEVTRSWL